MEFPNLGEYHDNLSLEEAIRIYQEIPAAVSYTHLFVDHFPKNTELYRIMTTKPQELKKEDE